MKQNINRPVRSTASQMIAICAILTLLCGDLGVGLVLRQELITGQTYSPTVVFGDSRMIYKSSSPTAYWTDMRLYMFGFVGGLIAATFGLREVVIEQKRKNAVTAVQGKARRDNILLIVCSLVFLGLLLVIGLLLLRASQ
jgi:hypothetical protein